jgi:hypothetical protein
MINRVFIAFQISALFFVLSTSAFAAPQTMRLDYYHTGGRQQELLSLDRIVIEGAMYEARGYYRPEIDCVMFSRTDPFCAVCRRAIERIIDLYSRRA